tara:strand:+ start:75 stop:371 length:297 start_codon:yes stop_codon:yes gene_type:complete
MDFEMKFSAMPFEGYKVKTSNNGGHSFDTVAQMCVDKLMSVSETAPKEIKAQADAFKSQMLTVVLHYIKMAAKEDRSTVCKKLREAGHTDLAEQLRRL